MTNKLIILENVIKWNVDAAKANHGDKKYYDRLMWQAKKLTKELLKLEEEMEKDYDS